MRRQLGGRKHQNPKGKRLRPDDRLSVAPVARSSLDQTTQLPHVFPAGPRAMRPTHHISFFILYLSSFTNAESSSSSPGVHVHLAHGASTRRWFPMTPSPHYAGDLLHPSLSPFPSNDLLHPALFCVHGGASVDYGDLQPDHDHAGSRLLQPATHGATNGDAICFNSR